MDKTRECRVLDLLKKITRNKKLELTAVDCKSIAVDEKSKQFKGARIEATGKRVYDDVDVRNRKHRYYLYIDIRNKKTQAPIKENEILTVLMLNPSESKEEKKAGKSFVDPTITNVIRIAKYAKRCGGHAGFSAVEVLNLFSYIAPNPENLETNDNADNLAFVQKLIDGKEFNNPIMLAYGGNVPQKLEVYEELIKSLQESKRLVYAFRYNKDDTPTHPSPYCWKYVREFLSNPEFEPWPRKHTQQHQ